MSFKKIKAKKSLGQNFLTSQTALNTIVTSADIKPGETIYEIGPGKGALTEKLLSAKAHIKAIELDDRLIEPLQRRFHNQTEQGKFALIHHDALSYQFPTDHPFKIVANIPYYITSPLITHMLLEQHEVGNLPEKIVILIQKEVADKICDPNRYSVLSLGVRLFGDPQYIETVPAKAFDPAPKVDSAIITINNIAPRIVGDSRHLIKLIKQAFKAPRKKLANNLHATLRLEKELVRNKLEAAKIDITLRPESLSINDWLNVYEQFKSYVKA